jgi:KDO2-lipid IV(A) lauroyltransferase
LSAAKKIKNSLIFAAVAGLYTLFNLLPFKIAGKLGAGLGRLFFYLVPYERRKTLRMISIGLPSLDASGRRKFGANVFAHLGRGGAEFMRFPRMGGPQIEARVAQVRGWEKCEAVLKTGRGIVFVTAHMGHWELLAAWTALHARVGVVARQIYDERLDKALNDLRAAKGVTVFARNSSVKPILRWLKGGGVLGTLADQDTGVDSVYVDFFGREAKTPSGPAWLASATGAALMTAYSLRLADGSYLLDYQDEVALPAQSRDKRDLKAAVQEYTARTEAFIRRAPEQWAWNHDRWRSKKAEASPGWHPSQA